MCFIIEEVGDYLKTQGLVLSEKELAEVYSKSEGWISAIYLMELFLTKERKIDYALAKAKKPIFELIIQEIFSGYTPEMQINLNGFSQRISKMSSKPPLKPPFWRLGILAFCKVDLKPNIKQADINVQENIDGKYVVSNENELKIR